jgi:hypothetical protein
MAKIYDQQTNFQQGPALTGDSGENTAAAVKPIAGGEYLWDGPLNRSPENLRRRTEALRAAVDDLRYYADYDRGLTLSAPDATFAFFEDDPTGYPNQYKLVFATGTSLEILPALSPGRVSGGRHRGARMFTEVSGVWQPYAGTPGTNDISFVVDSNITGLRGYADINNLATDIGVSLGANRLQITLVDDPTLPGGGATYSVAVTGTPATKITITYGSATSPTTLTQLISKINTDTSSLTGSLGLSNLIFAATTSAGSAPPPTVTDAVFQGGYDAEGFTVTAAHLIAFFSDTDNYLVDGEGLALGFVSGPVTTGNLPPFLGRRQSLFDMPNNRTGGTADNTGDSLTLKLFNTGRHPELIPGAVPIGKSIGTKFVFIDGTVTGGIPVILGGSVAPLVTYNGSPSGLIPAGTLEVALDTLDTNLAATGTTSGAMHVGYKGSPHSWIPAGTLETALDTVDMALASVTPSSEGGLLVGFHGVNAWADTTALTAATVQTAIEEIVSDLASQATGADGAGRIGAYQITGASSNGNSKLDLATSSLSLQVSKLLRTTGSGRTSPGGVNHRVSEYGHRMHGPEPIEKLFSETGPAGDLSGGGGQLIRAVLNPSAVSDTGLRYNREEQASIYLEPLTYPQDGVDGYAITENISVEVSAATELDITGLDPGGAEKLRVRIAVPASNPWTPGDHCVVKLSGLEGGNGYYFVRALNPNVSGTPVITLRKLDFTEPALTVANQGTITFYRTRIVGSAPNGTRTRSMLLWDGNAGADSEYYGSGYIAKGYSEDAVLEHTASVTEAEWSLTDTASINSGGQATVTSIVAGTSATISGLRGMEAESVGNYLELTEGTPLNCGTFLISHYYDSTSVDVDNANAVIDTIPLKWYEHASTARRTPNIPIAADARLLRGRELHAPVDATRNHHHGGAYSIIFTPQTDYTIGFITWDLFNNHTIPLTSLPDYLLNTYASITVPGDYTIDGYFLEIHTTIVVTSSVGLGTTWALTVLTSPGTINDSTNARSAITISGVKINTGAIDTLKDVRLVYVPTNASGQAVFTIHSSTNIVLTSSSIKVRASSIVAHRT